MGKKFGKCDFRELVELRDKIAAMAEGAPKDDFFEACAKELTARLLAKLIKRTPKGKYPKSTGKKGGTLQRGWTAGQPPDAIAYAKSIKVEKRGSVYRIELINPVEYASYVNYGHRTPNHKGWVPGFFFLEISVKEVQAVAGKVLEKKLAAWLKECIE